MDEPLDDYMDIIDMPHHRSATRQPLPMSSRAAQFAPFAALSGYEDKISETARTVDGFVELSDDEAQRLSQRFNDILAIEESKRPPVAIRYFCHDLQKPSGGEYKVDKGKIVKVDESTNEIVLDSGKRISLSMVNALTRLRKK
ncbi:MAG: hypothetical protein NC230_09045 [Bacteroides sp.]|nr:hypothetical protein [Bacteroides sp.]